MSDRPTPTKVTMVIEDNPMRGLPGQNDFQITLSAEPDIPMGGQLPDPDELPLSVLAAIEMLHHLTGMSHEAAFIKVAKGSDN